MVPPADSRTPTDKVPLRRPPTGATPRELLSRARDATTVDRVRQMAARLPPAQPGARGKAETQSDYSVTSKIERMPSSDLTPAPLPPSPAAEQADVWFDQVPTNPAATPDIDALIGSRPDLAAALRDQTGGYQRADTGMQGFDPWARPSYTTGPIPRSLPLHRKPWVLPLLLTLTALTVGMVLGALLFGGGGDSSKKAGADCKPAPTLSP